MLMLVALIAYWCVELDGWRYPVALITIMTCSLLGALVGTAISFEVTCCVTAKAGRRPGDCEWEQ
jgi:hypothetical protein